jgi:hypothetical protein
MSFWGNGYGSYSKAIDKKYKPRFDRNMCRKCRFRSAENSLLANTNYDKYVKRDIREPAWGCAYWRLSGNGTALKQNHDDPNGPAIDVRGEGPKCLLFEKGDPPARMKDDFMEMYPEDLEDFEKEDDQ